MSSDFLFGLRGGACAAFVAVAASSPAFATLSFEVDFTDNALELLSQEEQDDFQAGLDFWDDIIVGHADGVDRTFSLEVDIFNQPAENGLVLLGSAGPREAFVTQPGQGSANASGAFVLAGAGFARFNVNPDAGGSVDFSTIVHEIGHTLGIGTLWQANGVYVNGTGEYTGANGLEAFQDEFIGQEDAAFVPVELDGGPGTANAHWNEGTLTSAFGNTGIVDAQGRDLGSEILSGRLVFNEELFLSNLTVQSLVDIGFVVVPEPSTAVFALAGLTLLARRQRRVG